MKPLLFIVCLIAIAFGYTLEYTMTTAQAQKLAAATLYFDPIPQVNTGTEENPVWQDSCTAAAWTKYHYEKIMRDTWKRYNQRMKIDSIVVDEW